MLVSQTAPRGQSPRLTVADRLLKLARSVELPDALVLLVVGLVLWSWCWGIFHRSWDYDELEHAHAAWLVRRGLRPFSDFFEAHPPFLWYPLAGLAWLWGDSYGLLFAYRVLTAVGHLLFLWGIAKNVSLSFARRPSPTVLPLRSFALCAAIVMAHPAVTDYLLEFRLDAWPNALLLFAVYWYRRATPTTPRTLLLAAGRFGFCATAAVLFSPKLGAFLACFLLSSWATSDRRLWRMLGMAAGLVACLGAAVLVLLLGRIDMVLFFKVVYPYHHLLNEKGGFGHGLADAVWGQRNLAVIALVSGLACLTVLRHRIFWSPFEFAVLGFSILQLRMVSFQFKQYYGPWFLLTIAFIPYLEVLLRKVKPVHTLAMAGALLFGLTNAVDTRRIYETLTSASDEISFRETMEQMVPKEGLVMSPGEIMPIFRRSPLFHAFTSFAPSGYGTEEIMKDLGLGAKFTEDFYRSELERKKPHLIITNGALTDPQRRAMESHLERFAGDYQRIDSARGPVFLRRPR